MEKSNRNLVNRINPNINNLKIVYQNKLNHHKKKNNKKIMK